MEVVEVSKQIEKRIELLAIARKELAERASLKAVTIAEYDKALTITLIKLREGVEQEFEGHKIKGVPATIMEKLAKGMCWQERLAMEKANAGYGVAVSGMNSLQAELNGWQSIYRHLEQTA